MEGLTAHIMVRNEPFIWYCVKSVYDYVDKILLWDTGSDDYTLSDIYDVLNDDKAGKIDFREVPIETDERYWTSKNWKEHQNRNKGKRGTGWVRQTMIDETKTDYFLIVDGDEVWYPSALQRIRKFMDAQRNAQATICGRVPLRWVDSANSWFKLSNSTRIFKTGRVVMHQASPGEMHMDRANRTLNSLEGGKSTINLTDIEPYAHFETMLKPWRRKVPLKNKKAWPQRRWPAVFNQESKYFDRYMLKVKTPAAKVKKEKKIPAVKVAVVKTPAPKAAVVKAVVKKEEKTPKVPGVVRSAARSGKWVEKGRKQ